MKRITLFLFISLIMFSMYGCASIPKESVILSQEIGKGIINAKEGYLKLVDQKFLETRKIIHKDRDKAITKYLVDFVALVEGKGDEFILNKQSIPLIISGIDTINEKQEAYLDSLEKTRLEVHSRINTNYKSMLEANATVTGLLQSAVDADDAAKQGLNTIVEISGSNVKVDDIFSKIDSWVIEVGSGSEKLIDAEKKGAKLYNEVKELLKKENK